MSGHEHINCLQDPSFTINYIVQLNTRMHAILRKYVFNFEANAYEFIVWLMSHKQMEIRDTKYK